MLLGRSSLLVNSTYFVNNKGNEIGAISATSYQIVNLTDCVFEGNSGSVASDVYLANSELPSQISHSSFSQSEGGSGILFEQASLLVYNCTVFNRRMSASLEQYALNCRNC